MLCLQRNAAADPTNHWTNAFFRNFSSFEEKAVFEMDAYDACARKYQAGNPLATVAQIWDTCTAAGTTSGCVNLTALHALMQCHIFACISA